jgi:adenosylmethionine-8-amino-7-oxononanoate aminotransferase
MQHGAPRRFVRGEGTTLVDASEKPVYDAVSSIWTIVHGHCHPHIVGAIARQAATLDHATALGASNPVADELAERLCALAGMDYAFFAGDGASAVEAAMKMALQYWQQIGQPHRTRFVHLTDSYHGDTAAAMSVSDIPLFKSRFGAITFETRAYDAGVRVLEEDDVAAAIVEPLVQAAAGMQVVTPERYAALQGIAPLVIVDEIATGFGRTGSMFACERVGLRADIMCLGKGITGGTLALSATLVRSRVYDAFLGSPSEMKQFFHGHSYAGNPIACAAALASLELFEREGTLARVAAIAEAARIRLEAIRSHRLVRDVRQAGAMIGIDLHGDRIDPGTSSSPGWRIADCLYQLGHFTRPLGDVVQFVPPLSSTVAEVGIFFDAVEEALDR